MREKHHSGFYCSLSARRGFDVDRSVPQAGQSPDPGFGEKCAANLPAIPSKSFASAGGSRFAVTFGHCSEKFALSSNQVSSPSSESGLIASAGHSGSQTPQSMHSVGLMTTMFSPS